MAHISNVIKSFAYVFLFRARPVVDSVQHPWKVYPPTVGLIAGPVAVGAAVDLVDVGAVALVEDAFVLVEGAFVLVEDVFDVPVELDFAVVVEILEVEVEVDDDDNAFDVDDTGFDVEEAALLVDETTAPCSAIPCNKRVVYPPSLHHVR